MPLLRPARPGVDWLTGEVRQWQSEGWLEAQYAEELARPRRIARRQQVDALLGDLADGVVGLRRGIAALAAGCARAVSRRRRRG